MNMACVHIFHSRCKTVSSPERKHVLSQEPDDIVGMEEQPKHLAQFARRNERVRSRCVSLKGCVVENGFYLPNRDVSEGV